ncbi:MAG: hypothetical protein COB29_10950 [Sulfitobacter sp.]|nr:MAG: hypothetical protein COB29_10950 [Sulfitobacter sp.]
MLFGGGFHKESGSYDIGEPKNEIVKKDVDLKKLQIDIDTLTNKNAKEKMKYAALEKNKFDLATALKEKTTKITKLSAELAEFKNNMMEKTQSAAFASGCHGFKKFEGVVNVSGGNDFVPASINFGVLRVTIGSNKPIANLHCCQLNEQKIISFTSHASVGYRCLGTVSSTNKKDFVCMGLKNSPRNVQHGFAS